MPFFQHAFSSKRRKARKEISEILGHRLTAVSDAYVEAKERFSWVTPDTALIVATMISIHDDILAGNDEFLEEFKKIAAKALDEQNDNSVNGNNQNDN